jgi:hypothetical protein
VVRRPTDTEVSRREMGSEWSQKELSTYTVPSACLSMTANQPCDFPEAIISVATSDSPDLTDSLGGRYSTRTATLFESIRATSRSMACAPWSRARSRISAETGIATLIGFPDR